MDTIGKGVYDMIPNDQPFGASCVSLDAQAGGFGTVVCRAAGMKGCAGPGVAAGGSSSTHGNNG